MSQTTKSCKIVFHNTTQNLQDQPDRFFKVSDRSCYKTGLRLKKICLVLVLQVLCCVVKYNLVTLVVIVILEDTAAFQVLVWFLYFVFGTSLLWRSTVTFTYLKVKSAKCLCLLPVVLVMVFQSWSWSCMQRSWSCYFGLGLKNLVLFT